MIGFKYFFVLSLSVATIFTPSIESAWAEDDSSKVASNPWIFEDLFGTNENGVLQESRSFQALLALVESDCQAYQVRNIEIPMYDIKQMCAFGEIFKSQKTTLQYLTDASNGLALPSNLGADSFLRGIFNLKFDFVDHQYDGFSIFAAYTIRKYSAAKSLDDILSLYDRWYGTQSSGFQDYYHPTIKSNVLYRLKLTRLLGAGLELNCKSSYFSCSNIFGENSQNFKGFLNYIKNETEVIRSALAQFPDTDLAKVSRLRSSLNSEIKSLKNDPPAASSIITENDPDFKKTVLALEAAVAKANVTFLEAPTEKIAKFFIYLDDLEELVDVIDSINKKTGILSSTKNFDPKKVPTNHFFYSEVLERLSFLKGNI